VLSDEKTIRPGQVKRLVLRTGLFLLLLLVAWVGTVALAANLSEEWRKVCRLRTNIPVGFAHRGGSSLIRFAEIDTRENIDILFVGSSHCYRSFDPRIFARRGLNTFNMGSMNQTPLNSYYLLKNRIDRLSPRLMIIEVSPEVLRGSGLESFLDLAENTAPSADLATMAFALREVRGINGLLARLFERNRPALEAIVPNLRDHDRYIDGGFVEKADWYEGKQDIPFPKLSLDARQLGYLDKLCFMAQERSIEVMLVIQPLPKRHLAGRAGYDACKRQLADYADWAGVVFVDFNDRLELDDNDDFYDSLHLRQSGVEVLGEDLISLLADRGWLPSI
jgi:hypothetical protein